MEQETQPQQTNTAPPDPAATAPQLPETSPAPAAPAAPAEQPFDAKSAIESLTGIVKGLADRLDNAMTVSAPAEDTEADFLEPTPAPAPSADPADPHAVTTYDQGGTPTPVSQLADDDPRKPAGLTEQFFNT